MSLEEIARLNADRAWSQHDQRAIARLLAAQAPQAGSYAGYDADREQHYATAQGRVQPVTLLTNGGLSVGDPVELHDGWADAMPRPNPQPSADIPNPVEPVPLVAMLVQFFTDPVTFTTPGGAIVSWNQVYYLFSNFAPPIEVFQISDRDYSFPGMQWFLAIDSTGRVHIDFKFSQSGVNTLRHFQVSGGVLSEVAVSESWRKQFANNAANGDPPLEPGEEPCAYGLARDGGEIGVNIALENLYKTTLPDRVGLLVGYETEGSNFYLGLVEEAIDLEVAAYPLRADDVGGCAVNASTDPPSDLAALMFPQFDLSGIPANYLYSDRPEGGGAGVRYPTVVEISGVLL